MKKILTLLVLATGVASVSHAQLQRGNALVGGDIADFKVGLQTGSGYDIHILPKAAWFINNNVAVGGLVNLEVSGGKYANTTVIYAIDPLIRYYVNDPKVNVLQHGRLFFEGNIGIGGTNISHGSSSNGLDLGFGPGYAYFITPNIGLETLVKYDGNFGFGNAGNISKLELNLGFQIYLPGRATANKVMRDVSK